MYKKMIQKAILLGVFGIFLSTTKTFAGVPSHNYDTAKEYPKIVEVITGLSTNISAFTHDDQYLYFDNLDGISKIDLKSENLKADQLIEQANAPMAFTLLEKELFFTS
jgi:hypothetical protein